MSGNLSPNVRASSPAVALYAKIPFHAQLKRADPRVAAALSAAVAAVATAYAATRIQLEESFLLVFDSRSRPYRLRAAEAARRLAAELEKLQGDLHGWVLILDLVEIGADEAIRDLKRRWFGVEGNGVFLAPKARSLFKRYFRSQSGSPRPEASLRVDEVLYAAREQRVAATAAATSESIVDLLVDELGSVGIGAIAFNSLLVVGEGRRPIDHLEAALRKLYPRDESSFVRLRASAVATSPYGPIVDGLSGISSKRSGELLSGAERSVLEELGPILDFLARSPYRTSFSPALGVRLRLCATTALRLYARERRAQSLPAFVLVEGLDRFAPESLELVSEIAKSSLADEGLVLLAATSAIPSEWPARGTRRFTIPKPQARQTAPETPAALVLSNYPPEFAEFLMAISACEGRLADADAEEFLEALGFVSGLRPLLVETLVELGLVLPGTRPRVASEAAIERIERAIEDGGTAFFGDFAARLLLLHEKRRIFPSLSLYDRIAATEIKPTPALLRLYLDCLSADAVYGLSPAHGSVRDRSPLRGAGAFFAAYAVGDEEGARRSVERLEATVPRSADPAGASPGIDRITASMAFLARAYHTYAERQPDKAASSAKKALVGLHADEARRSEARALRLLGLCALAMEQIQEGADYLANAFEVAESLADPLECMLSAQAEAGAYFVLGDLGKARTRVEAAAAWARKAFRADWEAAFAFMEGRLAFELGGYAAAEEAFGRVRSGGRVYDQPEAALRAEIWGGRAASWAGEEERARELLSRHLDDPEAAWFLAELRSWQGDFAGAARLADEALRKVTRAGYFAADAFAWGSGFASVEDRSVGFRAERSYLADQVAAFADFAAGMAAGPEEKERRASSLAARAREERLATVHPAVHQYYYYQYRLLETATPGGMDSATSLSKAFKALQVRASRMGDARLKDGFVEANRWNRMLFLEARARKLI